MTTNTSIDIGSTSITTLGTISTGTWAGTNIALNHGGTNAALTASNGGIFYSTASAGAILSGTATANQILLSGASTTPAWSTATYPATTTVSQILYSSSANVIGGITTANSAVLITNSTGVPSFSGTMTNGQVIIGSTSATPTAATLSAGSGISITNGAGTITIGATGGGGTGVIAQVQQGTITTPATSSSGTMVTSGLSVTITPSASTSKILIMVSGSASSSSSGPYLYFSIFSSKTSAVIYQPTSPGSRFACSGNFGANSSQTGNGISLIYVDSPATTNATTYTLYYATNTGTIQIGSTGADTNSAAFPRSPASITAMEIL